MAMCRYTGLPNVLAFSGVVPSVSEDYGRCNRGLDGDGTRKRSARQHSKALSAAGPTGPAS